MSLTALGFIIVFAGGLFLAFAKHPIYGLLTYLWAFYNHPPNRWWGVGLPEMRWSLLAAVITLIALLVRRRAVQGKPWHNNWGVRFLILYALWMWIQSFWALSPRHIEGCILFTKYVVLFFIIYQIVTDESLFEFFSWGHVIGCFILGWVAFGAEVSGRFESVGAPGIDDANSLAMHLSTGLTFAGLMFLGLPKKKRWIAFAAIPFILNGIILTASRGGMLGMSAAGMASYWLAPKGKRLAILSSLILGVILLTILSHDLFWSRFETIWKKDETGRHEASAQSRIELMKYGWNMSKDYKLGAGYNGHVVLSPHYMPHLLLTVIDGNRRGRAAHNTFMAVLVEQGYPGAFFFIGVQLWVFVSVRRLNDLTRFGFPISFAMMTTMIGSAYSVYLVSGLFSNFIKAEVHIWLLALLAALTNLGFTKVQQVQYYNSLPSSRSAGRKSIMNTSPAREVQEPGRRLNNG